MMALAGALLAFGATDARAAIGGPSAAGAQSSSQAASLTPKVRELFEEAQKAQQSGDNALAVRKYKEVIRLEPRLIAAHADLGVVLDALGQHDEAIREFRAALAAVPDNPALRMDLGLAYYKKGDMGNAADQFAPLHREHPDDVRIATLLGDCDVRLGRFAEAIAILSPLEKTHPDDLDLEWALGAALTYAGQAAEGLKRVEKVAEQRQSAEAYYFAANDALKLTYFARAERYVTQAIRLNPNLPNVYTLQGIILDYNNDYQGAIDAFGKALKQNPRDLQARLRLGGIYYVQRNLDAAREQFHQVLALDPRSYVARYELGLIELRKNQPKAALKDLEAAEREAPEWLPPHIELVALYYRLQQPADGEREKKIVQRLRAEVRRRKTRSHIISPTLPSH